MTIVKGDVVKNNFLYLHAKLSPPIVKIHKQPPSFLEDWAARLPEALWAYRTTWRNATRYSPYQLVFGKELIFPIEFKDSQNSPGSDLTKAELNDFNK